VEGRLNIERWIRKKKGAGKKVQLWCQPFNLSFAIETWGRGSCLLHTRSKTLYQKGGGGESLEGVGDSITRPDKAGVNFVKKRKVHQRGGRICTCVVMVGERGARGDVGGTQSIEGWWDNQQKFGWGGHELTPRKMHSPVAQKGMSNFPEPAGPRKTGAKTMDALVRLTKKRVEGFKGKGNPASQVVRLRT